MTVTQAYRSCCCCSLANVTRQIVLWLSADGTLTGSSYTCTVAASTGKVLAVGDFVEYLIPVMVKDRGQGVLDKTVINTGRATGTPRIGAAQSVDGKGTVVLTATVGVYQQLCAANIVILHIFALHATTNTLSCCPGSSAVYAFVEQPPLGVHLGSPMQALSFRNMVLQHVQPHTVVLQLAKHFCIT